MTDGILALQGDYFAHGRVLDKLGRKYIYVKKPEELNQVSSLIIPGGESTTIRKLAKENGLWELLKRFNGAILGTCAGIILLADKTINPPEETLNRLDVAISRNAYGSQINSFISMGNLPLIGKQIEMVFIRAPKIQDIGNSIEVFAEHNGEVVGVRSGNIIGLTFHPELAEDTVIYEEFFGLGKSDTRKIRIKIKSSN
ncbi:MAG: pyridoxal 5'-phosphate synthase glutaminase subunit PdxT [candidate division Zixibacteria bacterium]|nr:pyridoxal 5'-phosphate synthase glutaminase subunit PdxT [candidate division Zixibacteria bacterium]